MIPITKAHIGKRIVVRTGLSQPLNPLLVMDVSPSGEYVQLERAGWRAVKDCQCVEVLPDPPQSKIVNPQS